jgi:hypothetical protein
MAIVIKSCSTDGTIPKYICDPCGKTEGGRVRGAAYFHKSLKGEMTKENLELKTWWDSKIEAGLIIIVPTTRGTFDGGSKVTVPGFGDNKEKTKGKNFVSVVNDENHAANETFYNALENNFKDYIFGFRTESELRVATEVMTGFEAKDAVEEDTESVILWQANVAWYQNAPNTTVPIYELTDDVKEYFTNCIEIDED